MEIRQASNPHEVKHFATDRLRQEFLIENLTRPGKASFLYSHYDRFITGGVVPTETELALETHPALRADYFLDRRELGIVNVGGRGQVDVEGETFTLANKDALYVGMGCKKVIFRTESTSRSARFYLVSAPAHKKYPVQKCSLAEIDPTKLGARTSCNERTIYKMIHDNGIQSCQLVMGITVLAEGSIWNTMPCHVHDRRMEVYFYFDLADDARIFHLMGEPNETRHLVVKNEQAVISPPWSIHSGCGTGNYAFVWAMAGENKDFADMDMVAMDALR